MSRRSTKQRRAARRRNLLVLAALLRAGKARVRFTWSPVVAAMFGERTDEVREIVERKA